MVQVSTLAISIFALIIATLSFALGLLIDKQIILNKVETDSFEKGYNKCSSNHINWNDVNFKRGYYEGFESGWDKKEMRIRQNYDLIPIDEMTETLSGSTPNPKQFLDTFEDILNDVPDEDIEYEKQLLNEHFSGNIQLSAGTPNREEIKQF